MRRSGTGSGGGYGSRTVKHTTAAKVEPRAYARNPGAVAQYGALVGDHVTRAGSSGYRGEPDPTMRRGYNNPVGPTNMALSGPGAGRKIYGSGSQQMYGSGGPEKPSGRDILGSFGPESSRPRGDNPGNRGRSDTDADF
jgi:hypothetical protein